jgi:dolichyl-phosphate beta-glucosyltransferase
LSAPPVELSVVVPAYNEEGRIGGTLAQLLAWSGARADSVEILVVDDGSSDGTARVVEGFAESGVRLVRLSSNRGKGAALRAGVMATVGEAVLLTDADLSTPIAEHARLAARLGEADLVLGSRAVADARITRRQPLRRELSGKLFNLVLRALGICELRDTQCGFKLLRGEAARRLFAELTIDGFAYDVELVWLAARRGYRVIEVGVEWRNDPATHVRVLRDGGRMLFEALKLRFRRPPPVGGAGPRYE